jgi:hypothetical protein
MSSTKDETDTDFTPLDMSEEISPIAQNEDSVKDLTENITLEPDSTTQAILDDAASSSEPMDIEEPEEPMDIEPVVSSQPMDVVETMEPEESMDLAEPIEPSESPVSSEEDGLECLEKIRALLSTGKSHKAKIDQIKDILNATSGGRKTKRRARNSKKRRNSKKGGKHSKKRRHGKTHRK